MRARWIALAVIAAIAMTAPVVSHAFLTQEVQDDYASGAAAKRFYDALEAWDMDAAEAEWQNMVEASPPGDLFPVYAEGVLRFYQSRYEESDVRFRQLLSETRLDGHMERNVAFYQRALQVPLKFKRKESDHFIFHYMPEDEVLTEYVLDTMERVREVIGQDLGYYPAEKVVIEAMPSKQAFIDASTLTRENIETSGTIALCKYNRLMFTSPRVLLRGYGWLETIAHEYVHYVVSRSSKNKVPIWLHEGIAKYEQSRAFKDNKGRNPDDINALAKAMSEGYFITFDQMHPSMAKLKSAADVVLAFAEVSHAFELMVEMKGYEGIRRLFQQLAGGGTLEEAFPAIYGTTLTVFEKRLKDFIAGKRYKFDPRLETLPLVFKEEANPTLDGAVPDEETLETQNTMGEEARDMARLGDLLRERSFIEAAAMEYEKGVALSNTLSPGLVNKLGGAYMELEQWARARQALESLLPLYPDNGTTLKRLGLVHLAQQNWAQARSLLEDAVGQNPFDPETHRGLLTVYEKLGDAARLEREQRILRLLGAAQEEEQGGEPSPSPQP